MYYLIELFSLTINTWNHESDWYFLKISLKIAGFCEICHNKYSQTVPREFFYLNNKIVLLRRKTSRSWSMICLNFMSNSPLPTDRIFTLWNPKNSAYNVESYFKPCFSFGWINSKKVKIKFHAVTRPSPFLLLCTHKPLPLPVGLGTVFLSHCARVLSPWCCVFIMIIELGNALWGCILIKAAENTKITSTAELHEFTGSAAVCSNT